MNAAVKAPLRFVVYAGPDRFMLLASSFLLDRDRAPYQRLAATLMLGCRGPMLLELGENLRLNTRAALIAPRVLRRRVVAPDSDMVTLDFPIRSAEYAALAPLLRDREVLPLEFQPFESLRPVLDRAFAGELDGAGVTALGHELVQRIAGPVPPERRLDPRIEKALRLIDELPFAEATRARLAQRLHLSESRLSHLFSEQTGSSLSQYTRWVAVWRAASLWQQGRPLTEIALEVGFYDLSHLDHAFMDVFGLNPSTFIDPCNVRLIRYRQERFA